MITLIDNVQNDENKEVQFKNLNEVFISCLDTIVDTVDKGYNNWVEYYLENPKKLDDISVLKKIKEVEATDYTLSEDRGVELANKGVCQICGDNGIKAHIYGDKNYNKLSVCTACLGIEDRASMYRYSKNSIAKMYEELKELTKDISSLESFIEFAKRNLDDKDSYFYNIELDGRSILDIAESEFESYINGDIEATTLKFDWKTMTVYMDEETFELCERISVIDSYGDDVCDELPYQEFYYENHRPLHLY